MRRRDLLRSGLASLAAVALPGRSRAAPRPRLGDVAAAAGITFGSSFDVGGIDDRAYAELLRAEARVLTTDVSMKFWPLRPNGPEANFTAADRLVDFAETARIPIRGHTLIWNEYNPDWLKRLSRAERAKWIDRHVAEVMGRYAGRMHSWDVANEPFWPDHRNPGGFRGGPWYDALGPAWVTRALRAAAEADPGARLVLNEAFTESGDRLGLAVRAGLLKLVDDIRAAGLRLDAVGLQGHVTRGRPFDAEGWRRFLAELAARDVEIWITELDVDDRIFPGPAAVRDAGVAETYARVLETALDEPKVTTVITWQLADSMTHYRDVAGDDARPLPFDRFLAPKPAFDAMVAAFRARARKAKP